MIDSVHFAHSPCPNDTFIFHALTMGLVPKPCSQLTVQLADIEELNSLAAKKSADIIKVSVAAVPDLLDEYIILTAGGALGRGVGPVLVAQPGTRLEDIGTAPLAIPGLHTTAHLLLRLFCRSQELPLAVVECVYDQVVPAVQSGQFKAGLLIHEGRFTFSDQGLTGLLDLGQWWESFTGQPLPLGCIMVRRSLGMEFARRLNTAICASLEYAWAHPEASRAYVQEHAQELDDDVITRHIETFVTEYSLNYGPQGQEAIATLLKEACQLHGSKLPELPLFIE